MRIEWTRRPGARLPAGTRSPVVTAAGALRPAALRVQIVLGDDRLLRRLNREFRGLDRATDVLSFHYGPDAAAAEADGPGAEIYISLPRAARQAREYGRSLRQEFVLLALHGLLHVQGHDHHRRADAARMHRAEAAALRRLRRQWNWLDVPPMVAAPARGRAA
jgi:probable rRNA maturation factor